MENLCGIKTEINNIYNMIIESNTTETNCNKLNKEENYILSNKSKKSKEAKKKKKPEKQVTHVDYLDFENSRLILSYGPQIYDYSRKIEADTFELKDSEVKFLEILKNHEISPSVRTKLVDWLFEVFFAYKCDENTIYLTFYIMDSFLYKTKNKHSNSDAHLLGIASLSIASKFEDLLPIDLNTLKTRIAHGKFKSKEIKKKERQILETLDYKIIFASPYDFIRNFIYDFKFNNKKVISKLKFKNEIEILELTAIYISKIVLHTDIFSGLKNSIKAIACIILAFDLARTSVPSFKGDLENFMNEWIKFLVEQSRYEPDHIFQVYNKIKEYFEGFDKTPMIEHNLKKNLDLPF